MSTTAADATPDVRVASPRRDQLLVLGSRSRSISASSSASSTLIASMPAGLVGGSSPGRRRPPATRPASVAAVSSGRSLRHRLRRSIASGSAGFSVLVIAPPRTWLALRGAHVAPSPTYSRVRSGLSHLVRRFARCSGKWGNHLWKTVEVLREGSSRRMWIRILDSMADHVDRGRRGDSARTGDHGGSRRQRVAHDRRSLRSFSAS